MVTVSVLARLGAVRPVIETVPPVLLFSTPPPTNVNAPTLGVADCRSSEPESGRVRPDVLTVPVSASVVPAAMSSEPLPLSARAVVKPVVVCKVPPARTIPFAVAPRLLSELTERTPLSTVTLPVKPLEVLLSVSRPAPSFVRPTVPPIASEMVALVPATLMEGPVRVMEPPVACARVTLASVKLMPLVITAASMLTV